MNYDEIIEHHGVLGMKWGRRNARSTASSVSKAREKSWKDVYEKRSSISTADLKKKVARLQLENQLKMEMERVNPKTKSIGEQVMEQFGKTALTAVSQVAGQAIQAQLKSKLEG